jgi:hypothetical protein
VRVLASPSLAAVPFDYLHHLVTVPVTINGSVESRFVLDSGIGLTLVSASLADTVGCEPTGVTFSGRRMSGQKVDVPLAAPLTVACGELERRDDRIGILDLSGFPPELAAIGGFLSLAYFDNTPFTVDYRNGVVGFETPQTLAERVRAGRTIDVRVERDGPSVSVHMPLTLPGGWSVEVEVDMGSGELILDERLAAELGITLDDPGVRRVDGTDETGHVYTRSFTALAGAIHPTGAPELAQQDPAVMFQRIIYDGLVGDDFLRRFAVTFDVAGGRMIFGN